MLSVNAPSSMTPAFSHLAISRSTRRSPIRCSRNRIIQLWLMLSKNARMSASRTQFTARRVIPKASASSASCWERPGRNP
jgi:redox-sensitive bicupin YhaK (pirin superfamily)